MVIVESGWGSILPTVIIASLMHGGPAEKSGRLNIGDQIMTINGTSLVGLPLSTCQSIIKVPAAFLPPPGFPVVRINLTALLFPSGSEVSVEDQDEHRPLSSGHHGADPKAGPAVPAGLQRPERDRK